VITGRPKERVVVQILVPSRNPITVVLFDNFKFLLNNCYIRGLFKNIFHEIFFICRLKIYYVNIIVAKTFRRTKHVISQFSRLKEA